MDKQIHDTPSDVAARDGIVAVDGPDGIAVRLTPDAAEETSHRLLDGAMVANGQRLRKSIGGETDKLEG